MQENIESTGEWKVWNAQGFFPGKNETSQAFSERVIFCLNLKQQLKQRIEVDLPFDINDSSPSLALYEVLPLTKKLYGISPDWTLLFFSNHQLSPWHGGCAWIFQLDEQTPTAAFLQLRAHFRSSPTYLGLYHRNELITHELAHVGRMLYEEPKFEEFFAYKASSSRWRRWLGPLVQSSRETLLFILFLGLVIMADFALISIESIASSNMINWIKILPLFLVVMALIRLIYRHYILKKCQQNLEKIYHSSVPSQHLLYRLLDYEIYLFAKLSPNEIINWIETAASHSFRWHFLQTIYPIK